VVTMHCCWDRALRLYSSSCTRAAGVNELDCKMQVTHENGCMKTWRIHHLARLALCKKIAARSVYLAIPSELQSFCTWQVPLEQ